jgi:hypothetical protein
MPCHLYVNRRFGGTCHLHLRCLSTFCTLVSCWADFRTWNWSLFIPPKRRFINGVQGTIFQKMTTVVTTAVRTSKFGQQFHWNTRLPRKRRMNNAKYLRKVFCFITIYSSYQSIFSHKYRSGDNSGNNVQLWNLPFFDPSRSYGNQANYCLRADITLRLRKLIRVQRTV